MRRFWRALAGAALALGLSGAAGAQGVDPFQGRFGALEIAPAPADALRQAELLNQALNSLAPQRPGVLDVYIVSAAFWSDPVFEREANQAAEILSRHFSAQNRTIVLTNGDGGLAARRFAPASPANLQAVLARVGAVADPNEDLVVVFLTTHGAQDGTAVIRDHNRMVGGLRPNNLRDSLSGANIRNRLVIVSACFSGAFIAPLMDERTIVLTAAAPDRSSFGCQPTRDWTYFGDAYFGHALQNGAGVLAGFDQAVRLIAQWEREQNLSPPSNPQRFVGPVAARMVADAERARRQ